MNETPALTVDEEKVKQCVRSGSPVTVTTYTLPHDIEVYITRLLASFLRNAGREELTGYLQYCVLELAVNAKKANTKRVYFREKQADIGNRQEYERVMSGFRKDTLENIEHYLRLLKEAGYYVKVNFLCKDGSIVLEVRNNVLISKDEMIRIYDKLARARQYSGLGDAFSQILDDTEGAGLGIVVLVLMLRKMNLDDDCFEITTGESDTIARITIPFDRTREVNIAGLTKEIVDSVNTLPRFPENIAAIQRLASDPDFNLTDIAKQISTDPAMTADILKLVNSPLYFNKKPVNSITGAVRILGIRGIKNLLYSYGTRRILGSDTREKRVLWEHSYRTAFYCYNIVRNFVKSREALEDSYVSGMLHDMGKIIFLNADPEFTGRLSKFCEEKFIPQVTFESIAAGMNHAEIGALIAGKWNFPQTLVAAIRCHHDPLSCPEENRPLVFSVYLADMFCGIESGNITYGHIEPEVLRWFSLTSARQVKLIIKKLSGAFRQQI